MRANSCPSSSGVFQHLTRIWLTCFQQTAKHHHPWLLSSNHDLQSTSYQQQPQLQPFPLGPAVHLIPTRTTATTKGDVKDTKTRLFLYTHSQTSTSDLPSSSSNQALPTLPIYLCFGPAHNTASYDIWYMPEKWTADLVNDTGNKLGLSRERQ